ncbi:MAG: cellulase family glycosylhydrolase [Candidatus Nitrosopolaris sp.]
MASTFTNIVKSAHDLSKDGIWFHDPEGRYILFRGVNFASRSKLPPYLPIAPLHVENIDQSKLKEEIELVKSELDLLKKLGFNIIRLLISWKAIEPKPNPNLDELMIEGQEYLTLVNQIIDTLYRRDLYIILDFHQDIAHEVYGGDGFPDWALAIDEEHKRPKASNLKDRKWQTAYMINKLVKHTLASFWKNDLTNREFGLQNFPVRTHLEKTIGQTVKFFKSLNDNRGHPAILGIEPFNEPHPAGIPPEEFEATFLYQYYQNVESEVRKFDDKIFLFIEPRVDWTMSFQGDEKKSKSAPSPFSIRRTLHLDLIRDTMIEGKIDPKHIVSYLPSDRVSLDKIGDRGVLSFHYYDPIAIAQSFLKIPDNMHRYVREWPDIFAQLVQAAKERGLVPFLTEFGGVQDAELIRDYINLHYVQIESFLLNSTYWNYDLYNTTEGKDNWNLENFSLLGPGRRPRNADVIARPYPLRSSARPILLFFDIESTYATLLLEGSVVDAPTIMYIPYDYHYSPEFRVWATSKEIEWDRQNQLLSWYPAKDQTLNQIIVAKERSNKVDIERLPKRARDSVEKTTFVNIFP